jgi:ribosomal protein S13
MAPRTNPANVLPSRGASVIAETAAPSLGTRAMTLDGMAIDEKQIAEHARRGEGGLGEPARSNAPLRRRLFQVIPRQLPRIGPDRAGGRRRAKLVIGTTLVGNGARARRGEATRQSARDSLVRHFESPKSFCHCGEKSCELEADVRAAILQDLQRRIWPSPSRASRHSQSRWSRSGCWRSIRHRRGKTVKAFAHIRAADCQATPACLPAGRS